LSSSVWHSQCPMRITRLEVYALRGPKALRPHWTSHFVVPTGNEILVKMHTSEGISGFGLATSYTSLEPLIKPWKSGLADLIVGEDPLAPERLYKRLFNLTTSRAASEKGWTREAVIRNSAAIDIACWDIMGKAAGLPLFRLFGGFRSQVPVYATCGYYRDGKSEDELRDEVQMMVDQGHTGFKAKCGQLDLREDIERIAFIRNVIGPERDLMVDVNRAWDLPTAIEGARLLEQLSPRWLEEPLKWEDDRCLLLITMHSVTPGVFSSCWRRRRASRCRVGRARSPVMVAARCWKSRLSRSCSLMSRCTVALLRVGSSPASAN